MEVSLGGEKKPHIDQGEFLRRVGARNYRFGLSRLGVHNPGSSVICMCIKSYARPE